jgi:hypothetical protein
VRRNTKKKARKKRENRENTNILFSNLKSNALSRNEVSALKIDSFVRLFLNFSESNFHGIQCLYIFYLWRQNHVVTQISILMVSRTGHEMLWTGN